MGNKHTPRLDTYSGLGFEVVHDPSDTYRKGAVFTREEFRLTMGERSFPDGMIVKNAHGTRFVVRTVQVLHGISNNNQGSGKEKAGGKNNSLPYMWGKPIPAT